MPELSPPSVGENGRSYPRMLPLDMLFNTNPPVSSTVQSTVTAREVFECPGFPSSLGARRRKGENHIMYFCEREHRGSRKLLYILHH